MGNYSGHCACGAIGWFCLGPVTRKLACHCVDCQRATSSAFTAFIGFQPGTLKWVGTPTDYESSPGTYRGFCPACGTRLYFRSDRWPDEIHIHAATLDDGIAYIPDKHVKYNDSPDWLQLIDTLPKLDGFDTVATKET